MFGFGKAEKLKIMAENAQKQANITGKSYNITEYGKVIMTFHPEKTKSDDENYVYKTDEEKAAELKRFRETLNNFVTGQREIQYNLFTTTTIKEKASQGLEPCSNCQPCKTCNGKNWVEIKKLYD
jgi:DnaJ-class molecular chaperone